MPKLSLKKKIAKGSVKASQKALQKIFLKTYKALFKHGFNFNNELNSYSSNDRQLLVDKPVEMGYTVVVGYNPSVSKFFLGLLGGSSYEDVLQNEQDFKNIGQAGTKYYSLSNIVKIMKNQTYMHENSY